MALIHRCDRDRRALDDARSARVSNAVAQNLYRKYTFKEMGVRRRYYSDNGEDALVMWTDALDSESFQAAFDQNERKLAERLGCGRGAPGRHASGACRMADRVLMLIDGHSLVYRGFLRAAGDATVHQRQR